MLPDNQLGSFENWGFIVLAHRDFQEDQRLSLYMMRIIAFVISVTLNGSQTHALPSPPPFYPSYTPVLFFLKRLHSVKETAVDSRKAFARRLWSCIWGSLGSLELIERPRGQLVKMAMLTLCSLRGSKWNTVSRNESGYHVQSPEESYRAGS